MTDLDDITRLAARAMYLSQRLADLHPEKDLAGDLQCALNLENAVAWLEHRVRDHDDLENKRVNHDPQRTPDSEHVNADSVSTTGSDERK